MASFDVNVSQNHADSSDSEDAEEGVWIFNLIISLKV